MLGWALVSQSIWGGTIWSLCLGIRNDVEVCGILRSWNCVTNLHKWTSFSNVSPPEALVTLQAEKMFCQNTNIIQSHTWSLSSIFPIRFTDCNKYLYLTFLWGHNLRMHHRNSCSTISVDKEECLMRNDIRKNNQMHREIPKGRPWNANPFGKSTPIMN